MEFWMILLIGLLFGSSVYLFLERTLFRVVLGTVLGSHAVNLMLMTSGYLKRGQAPVVPVDGSPVSNLAEMITDPLPQALILTAIVIGFATTAFVLVLAYRTFHVQDQDDLDQLRGLEDE